MIPEATPEAVPDRLSGRAAGVLFRVYKYAFSPVMHSLGFSRCIYLPTCSEYAYTAIARFGAMRGGWLALRRLLRCHPWGPGGLDPVPALAPAKR